MLLRMFSAQSRESQALEEMHSGLSGPSFKELVTIQQTVLDTLNSKTPQVT